VLARLVAARTTAPPGSVLRAGSAARTQMLSRWRHVDGRESLLGGRGIASEGRRLWACVG